MALLTRFTDNSFTELNDKIQSIQIRRRSDREYLLYKAGIEDHYHLGAVGIEGLFLIDATDRQILEFVKDAIL